MKFTKLSLMAILAVSTMSTTVVADEVAIAGMSFPALIFIS